MPGSWRKALFLLFGLLFMGMINEKIMLSPQRATAQADSQPPAYPLVQLYPLDPQQFPLIQTYLDVYLSPTSYLHELQPQDLAVIENGQRRAVAQLTLTEPGVQFAIAVTYGPAMGIRDALGRSRYDYLLEELSAWENIPLQDPPDDLSLIVDNGPETVHTTQWSRILQTLKDHPVELRQRQPSLQPFNRAIEVVLDPGERPQMKRAVLFITPPQPPEAIAGLQNLTAQAAQTGIRIFVWLVSAPEEADTPASRQLERLAVETGGGFFHYTGAESVPALTSLLEPLRFVYALSYQSAINSSGVYTVTVEVQREDLTAASAPQSLELHIQPPNPVFIALPARIERMPEAQASKTEGQLALEATQPESSTSAGLKIQTIKALIEFPDGYPRPLLNSALVVDGAVVDQNTEAPFDLFAWDLTPYTSNAIHQVQIIATDTLGLQGSSPLLPVEVIVEAEGSALANQLRGRAGWLILSVLLLVGAMLGLGLVFGGRLYPYRFGKAKSGQPRPISSGWRQDRTLPSSQANHASLPGRKIARGSLAPGTSRIMETDGSSKKTSWLKQRSRPSPQHPPTARAYLIPLSDSDLPIEETPIPISGDEMLLGSDPNQADWTLLDPAIEAVHARLRMEEGRFFLFAETSIAGTWVNYQLVPPTGCLLHHGDLVHLGNKPFRFKSLNPGDVRQIIITPQERST